MAERRVEEFAFRNGISNNEAKRRLKAGAASREHQIGDMASSGRGQVVAGTGKPKGE